MLSYYPIQSLNQKSLYENDKEYIEYSFNLNLNNISNEHLNAFACLFYGITNVEINDTLKSNVVPVKIIFDVTNERLYAIKFDIKDTLINILDGTIYSISKENISSSYYTIYLYNYNLLSFDIDFLNNIIIDETNNELLDDTKKLKLNIGQTYEQGFQYSFDSDIYLYEIKDKKKVSFIIESDEAIEPFFYNQEKRPVKTSVIDTKQYKIFTLTLEPGFYYLELSNPRRKIFNYTIETKIVEDDEIGDYYSSSGQLPEITSEGTYTSNFDFLGDIDMYELKFPNNTFVEIKLNTKEKDIYMTSDTYNESNTLTPDDLSYYLYYSKLMSCIGFYSEDYVGEFSFDVVYHTEETDTPDSIQDDDIPLIDIHSPYIYTKYDIYDVDIFKFNITESNVYTINLKSVYNLNDELNYIKIYNSNKELIYNNIKPNESGEGYKHFMYLDSYLEVGEYYVEVNSDINSAFRLEFTMSEDDCVDTCEVNLTENESYINGNIDYYDDVDLYKITFTESTYLNISFSDLRGDLKILDDYGNVMFDNNYQSQYSNNFIPGNYYIEIKAEYLQGYEIKLTKTKVTDDFANYMVPNGEYIGNLISGNNEVMINYSNDIDIYKIDITEPDYYYLAYEDDQYQNRISAYYYQNNLRTEIFFSRSRIYLETGTHYFYFTNSSPVTMQIEFNLFVEDVVSNTSIDLDAPITEKIDYIGDVDVFDITITEIGTYEFIYPERVWIKIYQANEASFIFEQTHNLSGSLFYSLAPGQYKVGIFTLQKYLFDYTFQISKIPEDDAPNTLNLTFDSYSQRNMNVIYEARKDYPRDVDIFVIKITEEGKYSILISYSNYKLYNMDGKQTSFSFLKPGYYYLQIDHTSLSYVDVTSFYISRK